jgi:hypothetical protein
MFNTVSVCFDSIAWANNVDIAPETLYDESPPFRKFILLFPQEATGTKCDFFTTFALN